MKRIYSGLRRRMSHTQSSSTSHNEDRDDEKPKPPQRSSSVALLERATARRRSWSNTNHHSSGKGHPQLVLTADSPDFDKVTIRHFQEEGFTVSYLPYNGNPKEYDSQLQQLADPLESGVKYAIVAYGQAATFVLDACVKPMPKLCAVIAYYPSRVPNVGTDFDPSLHVQIHLAGTQGYSPKQLSFFYVSSDVGFAEKNREQYDSISAKLAWSRALGCLRRGFDLDVDIESVWEKHFSLEFSAKDAEAAMATVVKDKPYVNFVPTMTGGTGYKNIRRFYSDFVIPSNPPSLNMRLVSRTVGSDQIVDEMHMSFRHTQEIPWILPGVAPTDKFVELAIVNVVTIRGGKLCHRQVYWDHASVLVQVGLLDPNLIPPGFQAPGGGSHQTERLPVVGAEGARKVLDESSETSNQLIPTWKW